MSFSQDTTGAKTILHFKIWNDDKTVTDGPGDLGTPDYVLDKDLKFIRDGLEGISAAKTYVKYIFCTKTGSTVEDSSQVIDYLTLNAEPGDVLTGPMASPIRIFYLKKPAVVPDTTKSGSIPPRPDLKSIDLSTQDAPPAPSTIKIKPHQSYDPSIYQALPGTGDYAEKRVSYFGFKEWAAITRNNDLLLGFFITYDIAADGSVIKDIENARQPAFQYKYRGVPKALISPQTVAADDESLINLRIPNWRIDDRAYVSIFETQNTLQTSLVESSFSETQVKLAGSGNIKGVDVGGSIGIDRSNSQATTKETTDKERRMYLTYNFPRVSVLLDEDCLELTQQCENDITLVKDGATLERFTKKYGQYFISSVQLGGRLYAYEETTDLTVGQAKEVKSAMKIAASLSVGVAGKGSGELGISHTSGKSTTTATTTNQYISSLCWQANGGDTLICNNPPQWCPTVGSYHNWRITKQDKPVLISEFISKFPGYESKHEDWKKIPPNPASTVPRPEKFTLRLSTDTGKYLWETDLAIKNAYMALEVPRTIYNNSGNRPLDPLPANLLVEILRTGTYDNLPIGTESRKQGYTFTLETLTGEQVTSARYETYYRLICISTRNAMGTIGDQNGHYVTAAKADACPILFRDETTNIRGGPIATGVKVSIVMQYPKVTPPIEMPALRSSQAAIGMNNNMGDKPTLWLFQR